MQRGQASACRELPSLWGDGAGALPRVQGVARPALEEP